MRAEAGQQQCAGGWRDWRGWLPARRGLAAARRLRRVSGSRRWRELALVLATEQILAVLVLGSQDSQRLRGLATDADSRRLRGPVAEQVLEVVLRELATEQALAVLLRELATHADLSSRHQRGHDMNVNTEKYNAGGR